MLSDYFSEINDHGTVVPVKDLAAFPRSEQAVLGAKNIGQYVNYHVEGDTVQGYRITSGGNALIAKLKNNTQYVANKKSGQGNRFRINLFVNYPSTTYEVGATEVVNNPDKTSQTFNSGNYNYAVFTYDNSASVISQDTAEAMISFDGGVYARYAMTNEELTDEHAVKNLTITPATGITINAGSYAKIRNGILNAYISLKNENASISSYTQLASISGLTGKEDINMNFAGINSSDNVFVPFYCPFTKSAGGISIQTRDTVAANKNIAVSITAILE